MFNYVSIYILNYNNNYTITAAPHMDNILMLLGRTNSEEVFKSRLQIIDKYCKVRYAWKYGTCIPFTNALVFHGLYIYTHTRLCCKPLVCQEATLYWTFSIRTLVTSSWLGEGAQDVPFNQYSLIGLVWYFENLHYFLPLFSGLTSQPLHIPWENQ